MWWWPCLQPPPTLVFWFSNQIKTGHILTLLAQISQRLEDKRIQKILEKFLQQLTYHVLEERSTIKSWTAPKDLDISVMLIFNWNVPNPAIQRNLFWCHQCRLRWYSEKNSNNRPQAMQQFQFQLCHYCCLTRDITDTITIPPQATKIHKLTLCTLTLHSHLQGCYV